ncbi:hypothetical protein JB92DRAFT_2846017 [Gautieria morchelliformis]|nr:hypothetical protein JB92DRAFT_2846017 [Gautieria morchelliformis]
MELVEVTLGALEIGGFLSTVLYGIVLVQFYLYVRGGSQDPLWLQAMVWSIGLLETAHTLVIWSLLYTLTVKNFGNVPAIFQHRVSLALIFPLAGIVGSIVQSFFAYRVHILSGHLLIPTIAWFGAVFRAVCTIVLCIKPFTVANIPEFVARYLWLVVTPMTINVAVDILNTSALCFYLIRGRSEFRSSQKIIDSLLLFTVETGLITSFCGMAIVISALTMRGNYVDIALFMIYPKLFSNSILTSLNARQDNRNRWCASADFTPRARIQVSQAVTLELSSRPKSRPSESISGLPLPVSSHAETKPMDFP